MSRHSIALLTSAALVLGACSDGKPQQAAQETSPPPSAPSPAPQPTAAERVAAAVVDIGGTRTGDGVRITLGGERFARGTGEFQAGDRIDAIAKVLTENPESRVTIEGFTDSRGSDALNRRLSERRAESVRQALEQRGIDGSRIDTAGRGSAQPIADNDTADGRAQNRRVEITFVPGGADRLASAPTSSPGG